MIIVQKYGGSSVKSPERIKAVSERIYQATQNSNQVVVVVSAMGKTTDSLVHLAKEVCSNPHGREMDMLLSTGEQVSMALLAMALQELGNPAISLTGAQVGIFTEAHHNKARILEIKTDRIKKHLNKGQVVVIAGFQGISHGEDLEITTLGRGGSDTSAVAIAAALKADLCEIYTDVPGIYTTDPRIVPSATLLKEITCDEMLELASLGAKVLHPRAVEIARNYGVPLVVRSSWDNDPGTKVTSSMVGDRPLIGLEITKAVDGVEYDTDQGKISLLRVPDKPGIAARLFTEIARQNIDVDLIIQSIHEGNTNDIAFTVVKNILPQAEAVSVAIAPILGTNNTDIITEEKIAKIAISGAGMIGRPGIAATMFRTLAKAGVNLQMISTSEVKVSCIIKENDCNMAIASLCEAFEIDSSLLSLSNESIDQTNKLMPVRGVALDENQAQLGILFVPDLPGMAAKIFTVLADANISVDMIIQSQRCRIVDDIARRDIAFTVAENDAQLASEVLAKIKSEIGFQQISINKNIAKLSIVGAGMEKNPGIAARFFTALASEKINILMITTSEIKVSCVIDQNQGQNALKVVHEAFNLGGITQLTVPSKE